MERDELVLVRRQFRNCIWWAKRWTSYTPLHFFSAFHNHTS